MFPGRAHTKHTLQTQSADFILCVCSQSAHKSVTIFSISVLVLLYFRTVSLSNFFLFLFSVLFFWILLLLALLLVLLIMSDSLLFNKSGLIAVLSHQWIVSFTCFFLWLALVYIVYRIRTYKHYWNIAEVRLTMCESYISSPVYNLSHILLSLWLLPSFFAHKYYMRYLPLMQIL